jgi:hypothetical protein
MVSDCIWSAWAWGRGYLFLCGARSHWHGQLAMAGSQCTSIHHHLVSIILGGLGSWCIVLLSICGFRNSFAYSIGPNHSSVIWIRIFSVSSVMIKQCESDSRLTESTVNVSVHYPCCLHLIRIWISLETVDIATVLSLPLELSCYSIIENNTSAEPGI